MLRVALVASLVVAVLFIVQSGFRRRLLWSIKVTLTLYGIAFAIRIVLWPFFDRPNDTYVAVGAIALACGAIWLLASRLTKRYLKSPRRRLRTKETPKAWRSIFSRRG